MEAPIPCLLTARPLTLWFSYSITAYGLLGHKLPDEVPIALSSNLQNIDLYLEKSFLAQLEDRGSCHATYYSSK